MARMTLRMQKRDDGQVLLQMEEGPTPLAHMIFDAPSAEGLIRDLARIRAELPEGVTPDLDVGARMEAIFDPRWRTDQLAEPPLAALALRHPGLGWVSFAFPAHEARALGQSLLSIAEQLEAKDDPS